MSMPEEKDPLVCILPYNTANLDERKIIWFILADSPHLGELYRKKPTFWYTSLKNFKDSMCRSTIIYPSTILAVYCILMKILVIANPASGAPGSTRVAGSNPTRPELNLKKTSTNDH